jgi:tRNA (cmo5U34)-methyltransferase
MTTSDNSTAHNSTEYDKSVRQTIPYYETIQSETVDLVRIIKPEVNCWLDTGCGTGYLVEIALPYFPSTSFILTDPSVAMLNQAMKRLRGLPEKRVKYLPPTPSESLNIYENEIHPQIITAILSHHYLHKPQRYQATQTCFRLLDEDGIYVTIENIVPSTQQSTSIALDRWKHFQLEHGRTKSVVEEHAKRFNSDYFPISIEEHIDLLRKTGFKTIELFWVSYMQAGLYAIK